MGNRIRNLTIVGGGTAGWAAAAMLFAISNRRNDGPDLNITLIESPTVSTVGVGESTTGHMPWTLRMLRIDEKDFIKHCDASFKVGVKFVGWDVDPRNGAGSVYYNTFEAPPSIEGFSSAYHYQRRVKAGRAERPFAQTVTRAAAVMDACRAPKADKSQDFQGVTGYSYHLDAKLFAAYMQDYCTTMGVEHISDDVVGVERAENGDVAALQLAGRGRYPVDFVIDCSGFRGLIARQALEEPYISYADQLPCDRALALQIPFEDGMPIEPFTTAAALKNGWAWHVPLQTRRGTGYVYSSAFASDDAAIAEFKAVVGDAARDQDVKVIKMPIGRLRRSWVNNVVAIGLAGGFMEPLEATNIHFIQSSIRWLMVNFPDSEITPALRDNYNDLVQRHHDEIRDFVQLHYCISNRTDTPFWQACRNDLKRSDRLSGLLEIWRSRMPSQSDVAGPTAMFEDWNYTLVLQGKHYFHGLTFPNEDAVADQDFEVTARRIAKEQEQMLQALPDHRAYLEQIRDTVTSPWYRPDGNASHHDLQSSVAT